MKRLTLLAFMMLLIFVAAPKPASAQGATFPYVFTGTPLTCFPQSNCFNYLFIPQGWYGSIYETGVIQCYQSLPWAQGYRLNMTVQDSSAYCRTQTLVEAYLTTTTKWYYAPGNPWANNNVLYASTLQGNGWVYSIINGQYYLVGSETKTQDCYTGYEIESGGQGGTC
jgi:hypothetical protein